MEEKSFSDAAKKLGISQPSLSQYISKIEEECGNPLFERSIPLKLTYAGEVYVEHARRIVNSRRQMNEILADVSAEDAGRIIIGAGPLNSMSFLPEIIEKYHEKWPRVFVEMLEFPEKSLALKAEEGAFDIALTTSRVDERKFVYVPVHEEDVMLAVRSDNEFCIRHKGQTVKAKDLSELMFIEMDDSFPIQKSLMTIFSEMGEDVKYSMQCSSIMTGYSLAMHGLGAMLIPEGIVRQSEKSNMKFYKIDPSPDTRSFGIYYQKGKYLSRAVQNFIDTVMEVCKNK